MKEPHAWAVMRGSRPLFHTPGTWPPVYEVNEALEMLWRAKQKKREMRQLSFLDNYDQVELVKKEIFSCKH